MANTKKLDKSKRKAAKRTARKALTKLGTDLSRKQRGEFRKSGKGIKAFLAEAQKKAE
jgi:hypothetical protein